MSRSLAVKTRVGSGEAGFLLVDGCSWENIRRGIHGSTSEHRDGLCAVVSEHLGATASDLGSVVECANCRALSEHWCRDGKCATEDNEVGIKMIIQGRSTMMRHVSRTRGVCLTESIWTPKPKPNMLFKPKMLTPKTNLLTC